MKSNCSFASSEPSSTGKSTPTCPRKFETYGWPSAEVSPSEARYFCDCAVAHESEGGALAWPQGDRPISGHRSVGEPSYVQLRMPSCGVTSTAGPAGGPNVVPPSTKSVCPPVTPKTCARRTAEACALIGHEMRYTGSEPGEFVSPEPTVRFIRYG